MVTSPTTWQSGFWPRSPFCTSDSAKAVPMVVLEHCTSAGRHFDLMFDITAATTPFDARDPDERTLRTARCDCPPGQWQTGQMHLLSILKDHRRIYLTRQGQVSNGRGWVRRVDQGNARCRSEGSTSIWDLELATFRGRIRIHAQVRTDDPCSRSSKLKSTGCMPPAKLCVIGSW